LNELHQEFPATTAVIAWHNGDEFEFPQGMVRDGWYGITGYPTVWFDGVTDVIGGGVPMYPYYLPVYEERIGTPSNFGIEMEISNVDGTDYNVDATVELFEGINTENLAYFVVLTETDLESPGSETQTFVARNVYPDGMGLPVDFSTQTTQSFNTVITLEDEYVFENCEVIVFIQNMDTREIYQGTSQMMTEIVGMDEVKTFEMEVYPNPSTNRVTIKAGSSIQKLEIFNQLGQMVKQIESDYHILNMDVSDLDKGIYLVKVISHNKEITRKLVIE